jgi:release factor glutamine methyltransferase
LKKFLRKTTGIVFRPVLRFYLQKDRRYKFRQTQIIVKKNVFHPGFFFSTKFLLAYLNRFNLKDRSLLELCAGTGLIAIECAKRGASVTATDLSEDAIENLYMNAAMNRVNIKVIHSDLFDCIPSQIFDFIVLNPPYYKKDAQRSSELAWYAGKDLEFFRKLFRQIKSFMSQTTTVCMVLSEDCDLNSITEIAGENGLLLELKEQKLFYWERNYIFQIALRPR